MALREEDEEFEGFRDLRPDWCERSIRTRLATPDAVPRSTSVASACDVLGGVSPPEVLPLEIILTMPRFFISWEYLRSLALCCRRFRLAVLNASNWAGLDLLVDMPEYTMADVLRPVARLFALARSVTAGVPQLPSLDCLPCELLVRWEGWHVTQPPTLEEDQLHVWESQGLLVYYRVGRPPK